MWGIYTRNPGLPAKRRGSLNGKSRVTESDVRELRRLASAGTPSIDLQRKFGIARTTVRDILRGRTWGHLV
jgi:DNA invertase Pin-like site-specific DNA recombinase